MERRLSAMARGRLEIERQFRKEKKKSSRRAVKFLELYNLANELKDMVKGKTAEISESSREISELLAQVFYMKEDLKEKESEKGLMIEQQKEEKKKFDETVEELRVKGESLTEVSTKALALTERVRELDDDAETREDKLSVWGLKQTEETKRLTKEAAEKDAIKSNNNYELLNQAERISALSTMLQENEQQSKGKSILIEAKDSESARTKKALAEKSSEIAQNHAKLETTLAQKNNLVIESSKLGEMRDKEFGEKEIKIADLMKQLEERLRQASDQYAIITGLESRLRDDDERIVSLQGTLRMKEDVITSAKGHIDALALEAERTAEL
jgi:chromosome segregation ATPase